MRVDLTYDHHHTFRCRSCKRQFTVSRPRLDPCDVVRCTRCESPDTYIHHSLFKRIRHFMMLYELA